MEHDKNIINEIFEKYEQQRLYGKAINWNLVDSEFKQRLNIIYKEIKPIIVEQYAQGSYQELCYGYAKANPSTAYNALIKNYELQRK